MSIPITIASGFIVLMWGYNTFRKHRILIAAIIGSYIVFSIAFFLVPAANNFFVQQALTQPDLSLKKALPAMMQKIESYGIKNKGLKGAGKQFRPLPDLLNVRYIEITDMGQIIIQKRTNIASITLLFLNPVWQNDKVTWKCFGWPEITLPDRCHTHEYKAE